MDFVSASKFRRDATISAHGYPAVVGRSTQTFSLYVTKHKKLSMFKPWASNAIITDPTTSYLTWTAHAYRHLGNNIIIAEKTYELVDPVGSFGYFVQHIGSAVREWKDRVIGTEKVSDNLYWLSTPQNGKSIITTEIEARETTPINWWLWVLLFIIALVVFLLWHRRPRLP